MTFSKQCSRKAVSISFVLTCFCVVYVLGNNRKTLFFKKEGDMSIPIACAIEAEGVDNMAVKYDAAQNCQNLGWEWGHVYDGVSTYFEKQHVVKEYNEPAPLRGTIRLPILFAAGAYVNMHIEFTSVSVPYGSIRLLDTLFDTHDLYDDIPEVVMTSFELWGGVSLAVQSFNGWWYGRLTDYPMPFQTGIVYKITFKALGNDFQVLINDGIIVHYILDIHSSNAKLLHFDDFGMLLHKIEFVA